MKKFNLFAICVMVCLLAGCEPNNPIDSGKTDEEELIITGDSSEITTESATLHGVVNIDINAYSSVQFGVLVTESENQIRDYKGKLYSARTLIGNDFEIRIDGLSPNTKYYYRAWVLLNSTQYKFGSISDFSTLALPNNGIENNHEWVELGLSVKWATCNIGANNPEDNGKYYAWGEVDSKSYYDFDSYKHGYTYIYPSGEHKYIYTKYDKLSDTTLVSSDDAASVNWGGNWRIPSESNWKELLEKCTWKWICQNGKYGYKITSNMDGFTNNSIFLPAGGCRLMDEYSDVGECGYYWSNLLDTDYNTLYGDRPDWAYSVSFSTSYMSWGSYQRIIGLTVRAVCP